MAFDFNKEVLFDVDLHKEYTPEDYNEIVERVYPFVSMNKDKHPFKLYYNEKTGSYTLYFKETSMTANWPKFLRSMLPYAYIMLQVFSNPKFYIIMTPPPVLRGGTINLSFAKLLDGDSKLDNLNLLMFTVRLMSLLSRKPCCNCKLRLLLPYNKLFNSVDAQAIELLDKFLDWCDRNIDITGNIMMATSFTFRVMSQFSQAYRMRHTPDGSSLKPISLYSFAAEVRRYINN